MTSKLMTTVATENARRVSDESNTDTVSHFVYRISGYDLGARRVSDDSRRRDFIHILVATRL